MNVARNNILKLTIGGGCVLGSIAFPPLLAAEGIVWGTVLATALGNVAAGNTANALDALIDGGEGGVSLENQDLTKAVGKAIAAVITLAAKQHPGKTRQYLEKIAAQAKDNWLHIAQQELTQQRYPELREAKLDQFLTPEESQLTQQGNLTDTEWGDIFIRLNMAANKGKGGFPIPSEVRQQVAELLHTTFPKALRETLKEDFAKDGKAFAGLTLQLLTGMQAQLRQLQASQEGVNGEEFSQILQQFQELETQLRGSVTQQQEFFRDISCGIESGFAEVCERLGVMETQISQLLQGLERTLESLVAEIRSHFDAANPHLSLAEWRSIAELMLAERQALTANPAFKRVDVYVPLALVERRQTKERKPGQSLENREEWEREEEKMTPIAEDEFFNQVLRQGKSPKSQGRRIAVIGEPGSGKTTRLQAIADWILAEHLGIPIWIELAQFTEPTLVDYLEKWLKSAGVAGAITSLQDHKEHLWLLMDGLDEMVARIEQPHVSQLLTGWVGLGRAIITCRVNVWEADQNAFSGFDVYRNLPFEAKEMETFIRRFFAQTD
ncbi:NACHT domain-containing protein [Spirulina subsalsa]|uniref:NACHT domain-containing protein n=1 Tax=Spirulina subsalsa TaxID=54311 RepID=UPI0002E561C1|nr:NACHT domain-containing protein [Spirulina subsalsa]